MKNKYLIGSLALFVSFNAHAEGFDYNIGGHSKGLYGYNDVASQYKKQNDNYKFTGDAEINSSISYEFDNDVSASLNLDIMQGFNQELRDYNNGTWGKELYGIVDSNFGRVMLGETFNTAYQFHQGPETVGNISPIDFISSPNTIRSKKNTSYKTLNSTKINTDGVAPKVNYITPEFYDTMLGFTYVNDIDNRRGLTDNRLHYDNKDGYITSVYNNLDLDFVDVHSSLSYAQYRDEDKEFAGSIKLLKGGWSLASSYRKAYIDGKKDPISATLADNYREGKAWDVGVGYEIGPYSVSLTYFNAKAKNTDNEDKIVTLSNKYQVNKWADVYLAVAHVDHKGEDKAIENNNKGYAFITGLGLSF